MGKNIYLDQNIFSKIVNKETDYKILESQIQRLSGLGYIFPYSPAHIEEVYRAPKKMHRKFLDLISDISKNYEILPRRNKPTYIRQESPDTCYDRVKKFDTTKTIKAITESSAAFKSEHQYKKHFQTDSFIGDDYSNLTTTRQNNSSTFNLGELYNLSALEFTSHSYVIEQLKIYNAKKNSNSSLRDLIIDEGLISTLLQYPMSDEMKDVILKNHTSFLDNINHVHSVDEYLDLSLSFNSIKDNHSKIEFHLQELFHFFDFIGFHPESFDNAISAEHDISHAIYGTMAQYIVTNDERFSKKIKIAYEIFGVPTKVISQNQLADIPTEK